MRTGYYLAVLLLLLDLTVLFQPAQSISFIKISIPTAFALITAAVKIKAIILKILFGLRALGVKSFYVRRRRKRFADESRLLSSTENDELLNAWLTLEKTLGKEIQFQLDPCLKSIKFKKKSMVLWNSVIPKKSENSPASKSRFLKKPTSENYSSWVSGIIGSITGTKEACHLLYEELKHLKYSKLISKHRTS